MVEMVELTSEWSLDIMITKGNMFIAYAQHYASIEFVPSGNLLSNSGKAIRGA